MSVKEVKNMEETKPKKGRPKKIVEPVVNPAIDETVVMPEPEPVEIPQTEPAIKPRSAEYLRVEQVYREFRAKYPDKWEKEKDVLLAKLELL